jgi:hypothetical protein
VFADVQLVEDRCVPDHREPVRKDEHVALEVTGSIGGDLDAAW